MDNEKEFLRKVWNDFDEIKRKKTIKYKLYNFFATLYQNIKNGRSLNTKIQYPSFKSGFKNTIK